jgi:hypothetical protein
MKTISLIMLFATFYQFSNVMTTTSTQSFVPTLKVYYPGETVDCSLCFDGNGKTSLSLLPDYTPNSVPCSFTVEQINAYTNLTDLIESMHIAGGVVLVTYIVYGFVTYVLKTPYLPMESSGLTIIFYACLRGVTVLHYYILLALVLKVLYLLCFTDLPQMLETLNLLMQKEYNN